MLPLSVRRGRLALAAVLLAAPVVTAAAQVRTVDRASRVRRSVPERRSEMIVAVGRQQFPAENALASATILTLGYRRQLSPYWLNVGGRVDVGSSDVEGRFFPYERSTTGDTTRYVAVNQAARLVNAQATADFLFAFDDDDKYRTGFGLGLGVYSLLPARSPAPGTGAIIGPSLRFGFMGDAQLTKRIGATAGIDASAFFNFDRARLRASDPARGDPVLNTPIEPIYRAVEERTPFAALRFHVGFTYRFGVRRIER
ncbi:MAG: hypothetical protein MUF40_03755 [Gemmatimonadaceae bacterium]|jgi:hypothetical protein|nr:hypothetical protein [Gemmatimonadaceae bacterium]